MNKKIKAKFELFSAFKISGRGLVLGGHILEGHISNGDWIEFLINNQSLRRKIKSVEDVRSSDPEKFNTGLLIVCDSEEEIEMICNAQLKHITALIYNADI